MANNTELRLLALLEGLAGAPGNTQAAIPAVEGNGITDQFRSLAAVGGGAANLVTSAALSSVFGVGGSTTSSNSGIGGSVFSVASKILESGFGLVPLVSGLLGLFGGGAPAPPPLVKYSMPQRLEFQGADIGSGISNGDYDQSGMPRVYGAPAGNGVSGLVSPPAANAPLPTIQVTVQTMDARSFLDHSAEIAQAVRSAMLNLSPLNDVVNEL